jgi:CubicO group peptidase (beta-lactamase class C family)
MSVSKSVTGLVAGALAGTGRLDVTRRVETIVPELNGTSFAGATVQHLGPHGGPFRYRSILTDVLGWVLERAAGRRFSDLLAGELWQPMGAEHDAGMAR